MGCQISGELELSQILCHKKERKQYLQNFVLLFICLGLSGQSYVVLDADGRCRVFHELVEVKAGEFFLKPDVCFSLSEILGPFLSSINLKLSGIMHVWSWGHCRQY